MFPADAFIIRPATEADAAALRRLAALDSARPLTGRVLIGGVEGKPAAALSLEDRRRAIADPFQRTDALRAYLRMRASGRRGGRPRAVAARGGAHA